MENDVKEFLSELLKQLKSIDYIKPEDIPNIDLYMDQVTTFMDEQLAASKRYESDKIQDNDKQLCQKQSAPFSGQEKVF